LLTEVEHDEAVKTFDDYMKGIRPSPQGDVCFILRAEEVRKATVAFIPQMASSSRSLKN
jgi:hypothetical protein